MRGGLPVRPSKSSVTGLNIPARTSLNLTRWRMTTAARLLRDTDKPLAQVASAVGYGSPFAFAFAFRREYATTPGGYRGAALS